MKRYTVSVSENKEEITCIIFEKTDEVISEITYVLKPCYIVDKFWANTENISRFDFITKNSKVKKAIKEYWSEEIRENYKERIEEEEVRKVLTRLENDENKLLENIFRKGK